MGHIIPVLLRSEGRAQTFSSAEFAHPLSPRPSPLPVGVGESASMPSGINPLQPEVHSNIHSNFAVVQDVAKPTAQPVVQSVSSTSMSTPRCGTCEHFLIL